MKKISNIIYLVLSALSVLMISTGYSNSLNNKTEIKMKNQIFLAGTPLCSSTLQSRAITAENKTGEKGQGGKELDGRKGLPCLWNFKKDQIYTFADIEGPGMIRHIWITVPNTGPLKMRNLILRFYWDDQETPSVEVPLSDFFGISHGRTVPYESAFITMPEGKGFNCYFSMPFAKRAKLTVCNETGEDAGMFFYQVDYTVGDAIDEACPYFHAQFRRDLNTKMKEDYVILDGVKGKGRYLGANIGLIDRFAGKGVWWGEGEVKMYIDGDSKYPTICGTGAEDYIGSGWGLGEFHAQEMGAPLIKNEYVSCYRFHVRDPIYFNENIKVTIQQLGNDGKPGPAEPDGPLGEFIKNEEYKKENKGGVFERVDDMCSTVYWYQTLPTMPFSKFPDKSIRSFNLISESKKEKNALEGEKLTVKTISNGSVRTQPLAKYGNAWSDGTHLWWTKAGIGDFIEFEIDSSETVTKNLTAQFTKAADYAKFQLYFNGVKVGNEIDGYGLGITATGKIKFGKVKLNKGKNILKIKITGANPKAKKSYIVGLDYIKFE